MLKSVLYRMPALLLVVAPLMVPAWVLGNLVRHWSAAVVAALLWCWAVGAAVIVAGGAMRSIEVPPRDALRLALLRMPSVLAAVLLLMIPGYFGIAFAASAAGENLGVAMAMFTVVPLILAILFGLFVPVIAATTLGGYTDLSALRQSIAIVRHRFLPNMGKVLFFMLVIPQLLLWLADPIPPVDAIMWVLVVVLQATALAHLYVTSPLVTLDTVDAQLRSTS